MIDLDPNTLLIHKSRMQVKQLPNLITLVRLSAAPALIILMPFIKNTNSKHDRLLTFIAAMIFGIAMLSDMLDGYLARRFNCSSSFGKLIDPLADKMLFLSAMIMMIPLGWIPAWLVAILFTREVAVTSLRSLAVEQGLIIQASHWGKYKSAFISAGTFGMLLHYPFLNANWKLIGWALLCPGIIFSLGSGLHYGWSYFKKYGLK